jgi:hypothetical protein
MKQKGVVLVFRPGTSDAEIRQRLYLLRNMLDSCTFGATTDGPAIHTFDKERDGIPVWYIP